MGVLTWLWSRLQFESMYNIARLSLLLATDFYAAPHCLEGVSEAIDWYRKALELLGDGQGREGEMIDAGLNLAQALVVLAGMIEDGAHLFGSDQRIVARFQGKGTGSLLEARGLFEVGERIQTREMEKAGFSSSEMVDEREREVVPVEGNLEIKATQSSIVVPALVLATILDSIANDLVIFRLSTPPPPTTAALIIASLTRAIQLFSLIPPEQIAGNSTFDLDLKLVTLTISATLNSAEIPHPFYQTSEIIIESYVALIKSNSKNPELPSEYADYLIDILSSTPPSSIPATLNEISQSYQLSYSLLKDPFRPRGAIPPLQIPSMIAFNLISQAYTLLLASHLSPSPSPNTTTTLESQHFALLSTAIDSSGAGMKLTRSTQGKYELLRSKSDGRVDWTTIKSLREALLTLIRVLARREGVEGEVRGIVEILGRVLGRDGRDEVGKFVEEVRDDALWEATRNEEMLWARVFA